MVSAGGPGFPMQFGRYVLLSSFGRGGMGEVFLAKTGTEGIERVCVLKTVRADHAGVEEYARRFMDEARVAVQLNHANICHVFDVGRVDDTLYLAMEYIPGVNIRDLLTRLMAKRKGLNPGLSLYFIEELLDALGYAHRQQHPLTGEDLAVVHRDISPHNVMVNFEGEVKLIDFGLAASSLKEENTESHLVMGKVAYMSPEQATGVHIDGRVDQFATGIMMYELLSGERYYGQMPTHEVWQIVGRGGHVPKKWDTIPAAVQVVISRALHPDYSKRYPDCETLREEVAKLRAKLSPGVGKTQARALMQSVYADRIDTQRTLLRSFASVPLSAEARVPSQSRVPVPPAPKIAALADDVSESVSELDQGDKLASQVLAAKTVTESPAETREEAEEPPAPSELSRQEMKFVGEGAPAQPPEAVTVLSADTAPQGVSPSAAFLDDSDAIAAQNQSSGRTLAAALLLVAVIGAAAFFAWPKEEGPSSPPTPVTSNVVDAGIPKVVDKTPSTLATVDGDKEVDAGRATTSVAADSVTTEPKARRSRRRQARSPTAKAKASNAPPLVSEPDPSPRVVVAPEEAAPPPPPVVEPAPTPPKVEPPPPKPRVYTLQDNLTAIDRCQKPCSAPIKALLKKKGTTGLTARNQKLIQFCANTCRN